MKFNYSNLKYSCTKCDLLLNLNNNTKWSYIGNIGINECNLKRKIQIYTEDEFI